MTVTSTTSRNDYPGTSSTGPFSYTFKIFAYSDLLVTKVDADGVETTLTYGVDFTATGAQAAVGGTITLGTALAVGESLTIRRVLPLTQLINLRNQGSTFPQNLENGLDQAVMREQQLDNDIEASIRLAETTDPADFDTRLPANLSPGDAVVVNATGDGFSMAALTAAQLSAWSATHNLVLDRFTSGVGFTPGVSTTLALSADPGNEDNCTVTARVSGTVRVFEHDEFSVSSTTLTFGSVIPAGATYIEVSYMYTYQVNTVASENATFAQLGAGAVTRSVRAKLRETVSVYDFGAAGDGVTNDTAAFVAAMVAANYVTVPDGTFVVTGFTIPVNTTLEIFDGAQIKTSGTIKLDGANAHLRGPITGNAVNSTSAANATIVWTGAAAGTVVLAGSVTACLSCSIKGVSVSGNGIASVTAFAFGSNGQGGAWCDFSELVANEVLIGFDVRFGMQVCRFSDCIARNYSGGGAYLVAGSIGFQIGAAAGSANTATSFHDTVVDGFQKCVVCGDATGAGPGGASMSWTGSKTTMEAQAPNGGAAFAFYNGGPYTISGGAFVEGPGAGTGTTRAVIVGVTGVTVIQGLVVRDAYIQGFNSGTLIELFGFDGLVIEGNTLNWTGAGGYCIVNTGGGLRRRNAFYRANYEGPNVANYNPFKDDDTTGFVEATRLNRYLDGADDAPRPVWKDVSFRKTLANLVTHIPCADSFFGLMDITDGTYWSRYAILGAQHSVKKLYDPDAAFSVTAATVDKINVYWDGADYQIQNGHAGNYTVSYNLKDFVYAP